MTILEEKFVFEDEVLRVIDEQKRRCIRSILCVMEGVIKSSDQEARDLMRKAILDFINDYDRAVVNIIQKIK